MFECSGLHLNGELSHTNTSHCALQSAPALLNYNYSYNYIYTDRGVIAVSKREGDRSKQIRSPWSKPHHQPWRFFGEKSCKIPIFRYSTEIFFMLGGGRALGEDGGTRLYKASPLYKWSLILPGALPPPPHFFAPPPLCCICDFGRLLGRWSRVIFSLRQITLIFKIAQRT